MSSIARRRLANQGLADTRFDRPEDLVRWMGVVQAQDYPGAKWAVAQRVSGATDASIDACLDAGTILRTHILRPTWHLVLPEDIRWMLPLTADRLRSLSTVRYAQLGLDAAAPVSPSSRRSCVSARLDLRGSPRESRPL